SSHSSPDSAVQEKAIAETEKRLREQGAGREEEEEEEEECRTTVNRTLINPSVRAFPSEIKAGLTPALEKDAKERARRRRRNEKLANALKEQGNEAFRAGDFALAIQRYSEGLEKLRDKMEITLQNQWPGQSAASFHSF
uniref:Tetratricopeptide repeat domain 12 n=1 Tax=Zonotrichia albicollis TaxID=44394 RepID=A0A8D2N3W0_ZONAL